MRQQITPTYTRADDFHVVVRSAYYPSFVESEMVFFSLQGTEGAWSTEVSVDATKVCAKDQVTRFTISKPPQFGEVKYLKIRFGSDSSIEQLWFVDLVTVGPSSLISAEISDVKTSYFPLRRWVSSSRSNIFAVGDCLLPQHDEHIEQRKQELDELKAEYVSLSESPEMPTMLQTIPVEDDYDYQPQRADLIKLKTRLRRLAMTTHVLTSKFKTLDDVKKLYVKGFPLPQVSNYWKSDLWFGKMRLQGANPVLIKVCHQIPEKFGVKEADILPFLEDKSLADCLMRKRIFITDLEVLKDAQYDGNKKLWAPMALFFLNKYRQLMPIAIQLFQEPGNKNPVFLPTDDENTWTLAKIYYNSAEAIHHECFTHLGGIHFLLDAAWITTRRELSPSHPIFKLMAPHFYRLLGNNFYGITALFRPEGIMDEIFQGKTDMAKQCLSPENSYNELNPKIDVVKREVSDRSVLPEYPYRDDIILFFNAIRKYVANVVSRNYDTAEKLKNDVEIQKWRLMLGMKQQDGGSGIVDLPGSDVTGLEDNDSLIDIVTTLIAVSSIKHAAVNYCQYEYFGFSPNSPLRMRKPPPQTKAPVTEAEILKCLPKKKTMLMSMVFLTVLSYLDGNPLGEFDHQYLYNKEDVKASKVLSKDLAEITEEIELKNEKRNPPYEWLLLDYVRNSANM